MCRAEGQINTRSMKAWVCEGFKQSSAEHANLGGLAAAGVASHHHHIAGAEGFQELPFDSMHRKLASGCCPLPTLLRLLQCTTPLPT